MPSISGTSKFSPLLHVDDLIPDGALTDASDDALDHDAVAAVVADLVQSVEMPANIALFGPWGSGKSSLYGMIESRLKPDASGVAIVRYDAWKFGGHSLQRNFLTHVAEELRLRDYHIARINGATETSRLRLGRFLRRNWPSLFIALCLAVFCAAAWANISAWAASRWVVGGTATSTAFKAHLVQALPSAAVVFGAVIAGLLLSNQTLGSAVEKRTYSPMQDADQFFAAFKRLMKAVTRRRLFTSRTKRLVVFIDELDRCSPSEVVRTLTDLLTFLDHDQCVFIVAADREVLETALEQAPQAKPIRENEPYYSTSGAFLDKVFQHQLSLPPTRPEALTAYAMKLANERQGLWSQLRGHRARYEDVVYSLVPAHIRSPRRVKVLMNNFVTNARVMESRGLDWYERAVPVAVLTVLQTEFPAVVRDFLTQPRLLEALTGQYEGEPSRDLASMVSAYEAERVAEEVEALKKHASPAPLLTGQPQGQDSEALGITRRRLNEQLRAYLGKIHAADIPLPTADLVYLQHAGHAEGLEDATLARLLDVAADTAPDTLVDQFEDASAHDRKAAVRFLTTQIGNNFGPSRANLVESACRIAERLDPEAARETARFTAAALLSEARSGRWREQASAGAMWLGLLDEQIADPMASFAGSNELERMGSHGTLRRLLPLMPHLGGRARALFPYFSREYPTHPDLLHRALRDLPPVMATELWKSLDATIAQFFEQSPSEPVEGKAVTPQPLTTSSKTAMDEPDDEAHRGALYNDLLGALASRTNGDLSQVAADALLIALRSPAESPLYGIVWSDRETLIDNLLADPAARNRVALYGIVRPNNVAHIPGWGAHLTAQGQPIDADLAGKAATTIATALCSAEVDVQRKELVDAFDHLPEWLSATQAEEVAAIAYNGLVKNPPAGSVATVALRANLRVVLSLLQDAHPTTITCTAYLLDSLVHALKNVALSESAVPEYIREIGELDQQQAENLDGKIGDLVQQGTVDALLGARLRVAARTRAGRRPLPASSFVAALGAGVVADRLLSDWVDTNPSLADVQQVAKKIRIPSDIIRIYSTKRNVSDRSKLWIALEKSGYPDTALTAVGDRGVNRTAVDHLSHRIIGVPLDEQTAATRRLVTADLSTDQSARIAAHDVALALLSTNVAGAGPNAAKIVLRAGGAAPRRKPELRNAFDSYTMAFPKQRISNGDLMKLKDLGLFTKRKKSPLAKMFGWLGD